MKLIGDVVYQLQLSNKLSRVYNVFHVSQLRKYIPDPTHVIEQQPLQLREYLTCEKQPMEILDHQKKECDLSTLIHSRDQV